MMKEFRDQTRRLFENVRANYIELSVSVSGEIGDAIDLLLRGHNICLTGPAGSGKTTVLRHLAVFLAESKNRFPPIFVPMRLAPEHLQENSARSLIENYASPPPPPELLDKLGGNGSIFIILDGLDEMTLISRGEFREALVRWIDEFSEAVWILSTRPHLVGLMPKEFAIAELLPLDESQMQEFLAKRQSSRSIFVTVEQLNEWTASRALAQNPLLLELISMVSAQVRILPSSRTELYSSCVDVLMRRWDKTRGIPLQSPEAIRRTLSEMALHMIVTNSEWVDISDLPTIITPELDENDEEIDQVQELLRSAFVAKSGPTYYQFVHKSFQEYFGALAIASRSPKAAVGLLDETSSEMLLEFLANLSEQLDELISELVEADQVKLVLKIMDFVPPERRIIRFNILKHIAERLGINESTLSLDLSVLERTKELEKNWDLCKKETDPHKKGRYLEDFVETVFRHVFRIVNKDRLTIFGEIDLICEQREFSPYWGRWQSDFFVECKNHKDKSPVSDINEFVGKASAAGAQLGFFISMTDFTDRAMKAMRASWGRPGVPDIVWATGEDFDSWFKSTEAIEPFLKRICRRANWGG